VSPGCEDAREPEEKIRAIFQVVQGNQSAMIKTRFGCRPAPNVTPAKKGRKKQTG